MGINLKNIKKEEPVSLKKEATNQKNILALLSKDLSFNNKYPDKKKEQFYAEISLLLSAGTDIKTALDLIVEETGKEKDRIFLEEIRNDIVNGLSFSEAIKKTGKFTEYEYFSVKVGEETSRVDVVLTDLADFFKRKVEQKRKISSALSYPIFLMVAALGMVVFMLKFLVPMFEGVLNSFNKDLPAITQFVVDVSDAITNYFILVVLAFVGLFLLVYLNRNKIWFRRITSQIILNIPVVGDMAQKIYLTRFCHSMNLLIGAKNPLLNSIGLVKKMIDYYPVQTALTIVEKDIMDGLLLNESMRKFSIFPSKMVALIKVAEEVNKLDVIFENLDYQYAKELDHKTEVFGKLIEPIIIVFVSVIIGFIVIAMYLPMIKINTGLF